MDSRPRPAVPVAGVVKRQSWNNSETVGCFFVCPCSFFSFSFLFLGGGRGEHKRTGADDVVIRGKKERSYRHTSRDEENLSLERRQVFVRLKVEMAAVGQHCDFLHQNNFLTGLSGNSLRRVLLRNPGCTGMFSRSSFNPRGGCDRPFQPPRMKLLCLAFSSPGGIRRCECRSLGPNS
jgi:hypothetical protein